MLAQLEDVFYLVIKSLTFPFEQSDFNSCSKIMDMTLLNKKLFVLLVLFASAAINGSAQNTAAPSGAPKRVNFGYSQNPKTRKSAAEADNSAVAANVSPKPNGEFETSTIAKKTLEIARRSNMTAAASPTEIYKIGVGDVLFISLQNAPTRASTYFTVLNDGTIDYPLANEMISVTGLTTEEVEDLLKNKVRLYENPQISVKVRENTSHSITVLGLVEKAGEKFLQREAVPLYVIKAEAVVEPRANLLSIKRSNSQTETVDLKDAKSEDVLIFPGDILEFKSAGFSADNSETPQFYYIGGEIASAGQKDFHTGLTLTQAILACGGLRKAGVKKAVVRRKNEQGLLSPIEFDLKAVKDGKQPDPILQAGDTIELVKY